MNGELFAYNTDGFGDGLGKGPIWKSYFGQPVLQICCYESTIFILHPFSVSVGQINTGSAEPPCFEISGEVKQLSSVNQCIYQMMKMSEITNTLIIATSNGRLTMYNLPDLNIYDEINLEHKIQTFDMMLNYLVVSTNNRENEIFDTSCRKFIHLKKQSSGFKYPITTAIKILNSTTDMNDLPHDLIFAQAGLEGKVSIVTTTIESQTEPTVTPNTAARSAPISSSVTNPSGIYIPHDEKKFIFRAHRSTLSDNNILVGPIYSLSMVNGYLVTSGYGGDNKQGGKVEGSVCFWDINHKRRVKLCRGFPHSVVQTCSWNTESGKSILVCGCSDDSFKNMPVPAESSSFVHTVPPSSIVVMVLGERKW